MAHSPIRTLGRTRNRSFSLHLFQGLFTLSSTYSKCLPVRCKGIHCLYMQVNMHLEVPEDRVMLQKALKEFQRWFISNDFWCVSPLHTKHCITLWHWLCVYIRTYIHFCYRNVERKCHCPKVFMPLVVSKPVTFCIFMYVYMYGGGFYFSH